MMGNWYKKLFFKKFAPFLNRKLTDASCPLGQFYSKVGGCVSCEEYCPANPWEQVCIDYCRDYNPRITPAPLLNTSSSATSALRSSGQITSARALIIFPAIASLLSGYILPQLGVHGLF